MKRPVVLVGAAFLLAARAALALSVGHCIVVVVLLVCCSLLVLWMRHRCKWNILAALLFAIAACVLVAVQTQYQWLPTRALAGTTMQIEGRVTDIIGSHSILVRLQDGSSIEVAALASLDAKRGDWFSAPAVKLEAYEAGSTAAYAARKARLVPLRGYLQGEAYTSTPSDNLFVRGMSAVREKMSRFLRGRLTGYQGKLLCAILLGERQQIAAPLRAYFQAAGVAHLFAISGFHIGFLATLLRSMLHRLRCGVRLSAVVTGVVILAYMSLVGYSPSVIRAGVMCLLYLFAQAVGRQADPLTSLFLAGLVVCVCNPASAVDLGFEMSFCATLGVLVLSRPLEQWLQAHTKKLPAQLRRVLLAALPMSVSATVFLLPTTLLSEGRFALYGCFTNLLVAPLLLPTLASGILAVLLGVLPGVSMLATPFAFVSGLGMSALTALSRMVARWPFASLPTSAGFLVIWLVGAAALVGLACFRPNRRKTAYCVVLCAIPLLAGVLSYQLTLGKAVHAVAFVTDDSSAFVALKQGHAVVVGDLRSQSDAHKLQAVLDRYAVQSIDLLALWPAKRNRSPVVAQMLARYPVDTAILEPEDCVDERFTTQLAANRMLEAGRWSIEVFDTDRIKLEPGAALMELEGIRTFLLGQSSDVLDCMMREGSPDVAILAGGKPDNLDRLRCVGLITNQIYQGVRPDLSAQYAVLNEQTGQAGFLAQGGRLRLHFPAQAGE